MQTELNYDIVFDAQQHFRLLLDSMSRPGKINTFPAAEIFPPEELTHAAALTGFALLNPDSTYFIAGDNADAIAEYLLINTAAQSADMATSDYVFIPEGYFSDDLNDARTGTPTYPEDSATFIVSSELISETAHGNSLQITLRGPGVNGEDDVFVSGINPDLLDFVKEQNSEYPLGVDLIITDSYNHVICIPRSNKFSYSKPGHINL
ncbi:MAG TPA: phosphonate C-P lyase system protein PhnH [Mucilaginibacter sp.]|jgi:alpha-D-ribose 1-methylphosphonate 5-triphosphate synthase subunit PhnH|nr:phosphonate C-P lyase system protein PhnH [Mucilaginibacter sp.]